MQIICIKNSYLKLQFFIGDYYEFFTPALADGFSL